MKGGGGAEGVSVYVCVTERENVNVYVSITIFWKDQLVTF